MRAILLILDSLGIGAATDAKQYGDEGSNTFGNIAKHFASKGKTLALPNLFALGLGKLGLGEVANIANNKNKIIAAHGIAAPISKGKDTPTGHWEISGCITTKAWQTFPKTQPTFPTELINKIIKNSFIDSVLGNKHASGTKIINELGEQHIKSGAPIFYTSIDSVIQIAAHEKYFGVEKLYKLCQLVFEMADTKNVQRIIARPFLGEKTFTRTSNRKDFCRPPHTKTLLDYVVAGGGENFCIGKIADIFAHQNTTHIFKGNGNEELFAKTLEAMARAKKGDLIFTNFIDFDQIYGHRRDVIGYGKCLQQFDKMLPNLMQQLQTNDLLVITADHGNDPTWHGSDHTRENVPALFYKKNINPKNLNHINFADIGATIANHLNISFSKHGYNIL